MAHPYGLNEFAQAYLQAALWVTMDNANEQGGEPLENNYSVSDLAPETLEKVKAECAAFEEANAHLLTEENLLVSGDVDKKAGHDFFLTREHHGSGFWDGDWQEPAATLLTDAAHAFGEANFYVGDDGQIYQFG